MENYGLQFLRRWKQNAKYIKVVGSTKTYSPPSSISFLFYKFYSIPYI